MAGNPERLADIIARYASEQERQEEELRKLCDRTSEVYRDMDVYQFVTNTDSALSRLLLHMGIDRGAADGR